MVWQTSWHMRLADTYIDVEDTRSNLNRHANLHDRIGIPPSLQQLGNYVSGFKYIHKGGGNP